jgi:hypothetical protein
MKIENQIRWLDFIQPLRDQDLHPARQKFRHQALIVFVADQRQPDLLVCSEPVQCREGHHQIAELAQANNCHRETHG